MLRDKHQIALLSPPIKLSYEIQNQTYKLKIGTWDSKDKFKPYNGYKIEAVKRFFRVGIVLAEPWAWIDGVLRDFIFYFSSPPLAKTEIICPKNVKAKVAMDFP